MKHVTILSDFEVLAIRGLSEGEFNDEDKPIYWVYKDIAAEFGIGYNYVKDLCNYQARTKVSL